MTWVGITGIVLAVLLVSGIIVKLVLKRKLADIDGLQGVHQRSEGNIIGNVGTQK